MLKLDHLAVIAPTLDEGVDHVQSCLGLEMSTGGQHPQMGTHNRLLRLGDDLFIEVIAIDPSAAKPDHPRWFGLDDQSCLRTAWDEGKRLRGWVARTNDLPRVLAAHGDILGRQTQISRGARSWDFSVCLDGGLPLDGIAPPVIDWGMAGTPVPNMPDVGASLAAFELQHPDPDEVFSLYEKLEVIDPPMVFQGETVRYRAKVMTPNGLQMLE